MGVAGGEAAAAVAVEVLAVGVVTDDDDGAGMRVDECVWSKQYESKAHRV